MYSMLVVKVYYKGNLDFQFIPEDMNVLSDLVDEAKKRFEQKHGGEIGSIKSLPIDERIDVSTIDEDIRKGWAAGAKTIPVYSFEISD